MLNCQDFKNLKLAVYLLYNFKHPNNQNQPMKNSITSFILFFLCAFAVSSAKGQNKFDKWPEIKSFHKVLAQTFHPSETGDLAPIKSRSAELAAKADSLNKSEIPSEFNKLEVKMALAKLSLESKSLHKMVTDKASDAEITKALNALHDTFHTIVEKCSDDEEHHDHDHNH